MKILHDLICGRVFQSQPHLYWMNLVGDTIIILSVLALTFLFHYILKLLMLRITRHGGFRSKFYFVTILFNRKVRKLLIHLFSATIFYIVTKAILKYDNTISLPEIIANKLAIFYIFILLLLILSYVISVINDLYEKKFDFASQYPIYNYLKVIILFIWLIGITLIICFFLQTSPWAFLTGIGAVSAVFLLVFKDTLLGIVASIQVTASNIVRIGDRISIDEDGIDGVVLDIAINTVKIRNGDNSIANIPTYTLASKVVKNWRAMEESGGRRIKCAMLLEISSIKICGADLINQLQKLPTIAKYINNSAQTEFTNLTLYREYITYYLCNNEYINQKYMALAYHLDPGPNGLPLEICAFTHDVSKIGNARIKSELFEHFFALLPLFELKAYQA